MLVDLGPLTADECQLLAEMNFARAADYAGGAETADSDSRRLVAAALAEWYSERGRFFAESAAAAEEVEAEHAGRDIARRGE